MNRYIIYNLPVNGGVYLNQSAFQSAQKLQFKQYQKNQIMSMTPVQLLIKVYDIAILECKKENAARASKALVELISALKFDPEYQHISVGLFQLYQYALDKIKENDFDEAVKILNGLRDAWVKANKQEVASQAAQ